MPRVPAEGLSEVRASPTRTAPRWASPHVSRCRGGVVVGSGVEADRKRWWTAAGARGAALGDGRQKCVTIAGLSWFIAWVDVSRDSVTPLLRLLWATTADTLFGLVSAGDAAVVSVQSQMSSKRPWRGRPGVDTSPADGIHCRPFSAKSEDVWLQGARRWDEGICVHDRSYAVS